MTSDEIIAATHRWLERSVIGLNLCPFAERVYRGGRVRIRVSDSRTAAGLLAELRSELTGLHAADPGQCETTLLIHPWVLADFVEYNDFLEVCEAAIVELGLEGELQVASFHPQYQFAGTAIRGHRKLHESLSLSHAASAARSQHRARHRRGAGHRRGLPQKHPHVARAGARGLAALMARLAFSASG